MPRPKTKRAVASAFCGGCRENRYNYKGTCERPGIDAVVTSEFCWNLSTDKPLYCRAKKAWAMPCHSGARQRWLSEWARTGKEPGWNYWQR